MLTGSPAENGLGPTRNEKSREDCCIPFVLVDEVVVEAVDAEDGDEVVGDSLLLLLLLAFVPALRVEGCSLIQGGSPLLEKSLRRRKDIVSRMMDALSSCEVMAGGKGSILASS